MFVYQIVNKINNKKYIGITSRSLNKRFNEHKKQLNCGIASALVKYGEENFYIEKLENVKIGKTCWKKKNYGLIK